MDLKLSDKQIEYCRNANRRWNVKCGAVRSGKSFVDISAIIPQRIIKRKGKPGHSVIFGVSRDTIERNVLEPMREIYGDKRIGTINSRNVCRMFGEPVDCIGAEKANADGKIRGLSIKYAYGDEIAKWNSDVFAMIESRLDKPYSCFDGACNPEGPNHWFKKWLDNPSLDAYIQKYQLFDNPFLPESFVKALCTEYEGTVYYDRYILGKWALAEGLIYPNYAKALQKPPEEALEHGFEDLCLSIDYGTQNAFAALLWGKWKGVWYAFKEYYWSGRDKGIQKTDEEYGADMEDFIRPIMERREREHEQRIHYSPFDSIEKMETIVDPSAASFIAVLRRKDWFKVRKAKNDVLNGIRDTSSCMQMGLIKIDPDLKNFRKEIDGYIWDNKSGEERPVKEADHLMDSLRYMCETKYILKKALRE